jgi:maltooligosyltrehalose trehalohydrolase
VHHALHALLTGERQGYYGDFGSLECLATVLTGAFFHAGTWSSFRGRATAARSTAPDAGHRFVAFLQNHDQIGNRAVGDRLPRRSRPAAAGRRDAAADRAVHADALHGRGVGGEHAVAVLHQPPGAGTGGRGARRAAARVRGARLGHDDVPDPQDPATFERSKLDWDEVKASPHREMLATYRELIRLRKTVPDLSDPRLAGSRCGTATGTWRSAGALRGGGEPGAGTAADHLRGIPRSVLFAASPA